jgi:TolB-like protein/DNA-binding winged helix-turn-helix (wHTH) protein/Tfp pilus assembly protein PilF
MPDVSSAPTIVRFGVFEVDLAARELRKKGVRVRLQEQPLQVLALLLEHPGQVVTRDRLKQALWGGTVVDFDHGLNTIINKLREALGDAADSPRYIETLPRRGYRFVYPMDGAQPPRGAPAARRPRRWTMGATLAAAAVAAGFAIAAGGVRARLDGRAAPEIDTLAVLPLTNLSGDARQDALADGMTEALITELGRGGAVKVLSYQTAVAYRSSTRSLPQLGRELGVDAFLVGTVLHSGGRIRITASLFRATPERLLWAASYELDEGDVLGGPRALARDVASRVHGKVSPPAEAVAASPPRVRAAASEAYLLGRAYLSRAATPATWARAREHLERAIAEEPGFAPAYVGLAELELRQRGGLAREPAAGRREARRWLEKALALDESLGEAHAILARIAQQEWEWATAEREYRRAIALNPSHAQARVWYAMLLYAMQRFDEAAAEARRAQQLDPASPLVNTWAGAAFLFVGRADEATASWRRALELDPSFSDASLAVARTHVSGGRYPEAIDVLREALRLEARQPLLLGALVQAYARAGRRDEALEVAGDLERIHGEQGGAVPRFGMIWAHAGLGDRDRAFALLERAYVERTDRMTWLSVDPLLEPLRGDPRFADLVRRVGLPAPITGGAPKDLARAAGAPSSR